MRSAIGHEREKRRRRIDTISLDAPVAGTNGAILADIITYENMGYSYLGGYQAAGDNVLAVAM